MKLYRDTLVSAGKKMPTDFPVLRECYVGRNHATALSECRDALSYKYKAYASWGQDKILGEADRFDQPFDDFLKDRFFIGDRAYTRDELQRYKDTLGVDHFMMRMQWPGLSQKQVLHSIEALAEAARDVK
jgi:alkanesulfonate monooxygenase SsuD/methylene tetrahydromethanopterin reductase-like flavin-dependent oxidoreductase (luciferase family)